MPLSFVATLEPIRHQEFFRVTFQNAREKASTVEAIQSLASWDIGIQSFGQYETPTQSVVRIAYFGGVQANQGKVTAVFDSLRSHGIRIEEVTFR